MLATSNVTAAEMMFRRFRDAYPLQRLTVGTGDWSWFDSRGGRPALMMLSGGLGGGESLSNSLSH